MVAIIPICFLCRWMKKLGVKCASEVKMRNQVTEWKIGDDIICEKTPMFECKDKNGKDVMKATPMAYIKDLDRHMMRSLDLLAE